MCLLTIENKHPGHSCKNIASYIVEKVVILQSLSFIPKVTKENMRVLCPALFVQGFSSILSMRVPVLSPSDMLDWAFEAPSDLWVKVGKALWLTLCK